MITPTRSGAATGDIALSAYGEFVYSSFDFGPDPNAAQSGSAADRRATLDVPRVTIELETALSTTLALEIEVEFEHAGAGGAVELEYDEFGEYEVDVENGGEVTLEAFHVTYTLGNHAHVRGGRLRVPVGLANRFGHPTEYLTALRSQSERSMVPATWFDLGLELRTRVGPLDVRALLINGLDSSGFDSKSWIVGGHQRRFEHVRATDLAGVLDVRTTPVTGLSVGGALYHGGSADNRPKPDMESTDADVTIFDAYARYWTGPWRTSVSFIRGHLENADVVSAKNGRLSVDLGVPRTPVASVARAFAIELGVDVFDAFRSTPTETAIVPFLRYEEVDTMHDVTGNVFADPRFERHIATAGLAIAPNPGLLVKTEYARRTFGSERFHDENTWSLGFGFRTLD